MVEEVDDEALRALAEQLFGYAKAPELGWIEARLGEQMRWRWVSCAGFSELWGELAWSDPGELVYVVSSVAGAYRCAPEDLSELPFGGDLVVLDPARRRVGLFDASSKLASVELPRLLPSKITFYSVADDYGEFSNFAAYPITIDGERWSTSEHYFQAQKFEDASARARVQRAKTPMIAARLGRDRSARLRRDWESIKRDVMRRALRAKFEQHDDLRDLLLSTGDATLIEHTENDCYWGDCGDGTGQNWLGRLLMELREGLRGETESSEDRG